MEQIANLLKSGTATVVDVRTPQEYMSGHVKGSVNIPLNEIPHRMGELRQMQNIVLCCASGGRSATAASFLNQSGVKCHDGGPWMVVNNLCY